MENLHSSCKKGNGDLSSPLLNERFFSKVCHKWVFSDFQQIQITNLFALVKFPGFHVLYKVYKVS